MPSAKHLITFNAPGIPVVRVCMDVNAPKLVGGDPIWEVRTRPRQPSITIWNGRDPVAQEIPVIFDGIIDDAPVESDINNLDRMKRGKPPPIISVGGAILRRDIPQWVIKNITWGDKVIKRMQGGVPVRLRQDAIVTIMEYIAPDVVQPTGIKGAQKQSSSNKVKPKHSTHTVKAGETLSSIAVAEYGDVKYWVAIRDANENVRDPKKLAVNTVLRLPVA